MPWGRLQGSPLLTDGSGDGLYPRGIPMLGHASLIVTPPLVFTACGVGETAAVAPIRPP